MQSIEEIAINTYQKNLDYFLKNHKELHEKMSNFELAIQNGSYIQKYDLDYINDYFDIKELKSSNYLYGQSSSYISNELAKQVNFSKNSGTFEGIRIFHKDLNHLNAYDYGMQGLYPIMNYYVENLIKTNFHTMKKINKYIFVGTGLGLHLPLIDKKISASRYLIIEDDIEIFKLSLFCTPYYALSKNATLHFAIATEKDEFLNILNSFLQSSFSDNRFLKLTYFNAHSDTKIKLIKHALTSNISVIFPYKSMLYKSIRPLEYIHSGYRTLNILNPFKENFLLNKPILLLGAGPSLNKNIEWLKENHNRFIIFAISATLKILHKHGIKPDIVSHVDGFEPGLVHYENIDIDEYLKDTAILLGSFTHSKVRKLFNKNNVFYFQDANGYFEEFGFGIGNCVGSFSLLLALKFNAKEFYLLGLDLAVDSNTGSTHSSEHAFSKDIDLDSENKTSSTMGIYKNIIPIKGNLSQIVYTPTVYLLSIESLNKYIPTLKQKNQQIYNLSDGAKIDSTIPKRIEDIDSYEKLNKGTTSKELLTLFKENSSDTLSHNDINNMKLKLTKAINIKKHIEKFSKNLSYNNINSYLQILLDLYVDILKENTMLSVIYMHYFNYLLPIITDIFNTQELLEQQKHLKKIDKLIQNELYDIESIYESALKEFIEKKL